MGLIVRESAFLAWLGTGKKGEQIEYYRGLLISDRLNGDGTETEAGRIANHAWFHYKHGGLALTQKRVSAKEGCSYLATRII